MKARKVSIVFTVTAIIFSIAATAIVASSVMKNRSKEELFSAIKTGDTVIAEESLNKYPSLIKERQYGGFAFFRILMGSTNHTPLGAAIGAGNNDMVRLLVEYGADVNDGGFNSVPLFNALYKGNLDAVWYLIEHGAKLSPVNTRTGNGSFIIEVARERIENGEKEQAQKYFELFEYLINQGVDLNNPSTCTYEIKTLFGHAAFANNTLIMEYLIAEGLAEVNETVADDGKTALMCAVQTATIYPEEFRAYDSCKFLLENGADLSLKDQAGKTAYDYAVEAEDEYLTDLLSE